MDILIVEADPNNSKILVDRIRELGHRAMIATTVKEAARTADRRIFDLVFLDSRLPDADGFELIPRLKKAWPQTRIILMSDGYRKGLELEALKHGVIYYMPKPIDIRRMKSIVQYVAEKISQRKIQTQGGILC